MVFRKRARKNADLCFLIDVQIIDVVQEYTYLGTRISSSRNFSVSREHLKVKALHALFILRDLRADSGDEGKSKRAEK